jgi:hypothetical protein
MDNYRVVEVIEELSPEELRAALGKMADVHDPLTPAPLPAEPVTYRRSFIGRTMGETRIPPRDPDPSDVMFGNSRGR